jgi:hypothetical protein
LDIILQGHFHSTRNFVNLPGNANATGSGYTFQTSSYVDAIAIEALTIVNDIPKIDPNPELHRWASFHFCHVVPSHGVWLNAQFGSGRSE